jgi:hypothetical protein
MQSHYGRLKRQEKLMTAILTEDLPVFDETEGKRAKEKLSRLLIAMKTEFEPLHLGLALESLLFDLCLQEYMGSVEGAAWGKKFISQVSYNFYSVLEDLDTAENLAVAEERNREAGGSGTAFQ